MAGYSQTPLAKKLGIKPGFVIKLVNAPEYYYGLFNDLPGDLTMADVPEKQKDFIHFFTKSKTELHAILSELMKELKPAGMIWVSWPKKTAKLQAGISENDIRDHALAIGLVDIKVCAVDDTWSGLKLVIPVKRRAGM